MAIFCQILADLIRQGIDLAIRVRYVPGGDREGRHELRQPQQQAEVDISEYRSRHELVGVIGEQDVCEIPEQEGDSEWKYEAALSRPQTLEWFGSLGPFEIGGRFVFRCYWTFVGHGFP